MDDTDLYREQIIRHAGPIITGRFVGYRPSYTREVKVAQPMLMAVLAAAGVAQGLLVLILSVLRTGPGSRGTRRKFKDLKKGPEFLVTPVRVRDDFGQMYEVEMHGHLAQSALHRGDLVQVTTRPQKDHDLPVKLLHVVNLTTLQPLTPRIPTMWSHLGPGLLIQAVVGLIVAAVVVVAVIR
jgi:hypothetical protein